MINLLSYPLDKPIVLIIPVLIVLIWLKRPRLTLLVAAYAIFLQLLVLGVIKAQTAAEIFGDISYLYLGIFEGIQIALAGVLVYTPVLFVVQWFRLKFERYRDENSRHYW